MKDIVSRLEELGLQEYKPRFFPRSPFSTGPVTPRKKPISVGHKWVGVHLVKLERYEGRTTLTVTNESKGYSEKLATATGLDRDQADRLFKAVVEELQKGT